MCPPKAMPLRLHRPTQWLGTRSQPLLQGPGKCQCQPLPLALLSSPRPDPVECQGLLLLLLLLLPSCLCQECL